MSETTTALAVEEGAIVRLCRELTDDERGWATQPRTAEFTVDEILRAADNPDPQPDDIDVDFIDGHDRNGSSVIVPLDAVEAVMSAAQVSARRPPTARQILDGIGSALLDYFDGFCTDETEPDGDGRTVYGRTDAGLPFGFTLHVTAIWETDE